MSGDFWDYMNSPMVNNPGPCNQCDADLVHEPAPAGAPPEIDEVARCTGCKRIVDAL